MKPAFTAPFSTARTPRRHKWEVFDRSGRQGDQAPHPHRLTGSSPGRGGLCTQCVGLRRCAARADESRATMFSFHHDDRHRCRISMTSCPDCEALRLRRRLPRQSQALDRRAHRRLDQLKPQTGPSLRQPRRHCEGAHLFRHEQAHVPPTLCGIMTSDGP